MIADHLTGIEQFEADLWKVADDLRANSNLASNEYFMPILGVIFLRHATNRYHEAMAAIEDDMVAGRMPERLLVEADFTRRRALMLPEKARYDVLLEMRKDGNLGAAVTVAMDAVEDHFPPLAGQLPKDYERFEDDVLEEMMRTFDFEALRIASGDVFSRIYEYFLAEFSKQGAHDNGEFFTPPSIVQTIVNVIEPDHGVVLDPACGSGGMFVQSSHFIEDKGKDTMKRVTFYGHEKNETTAKLAQINLAVHGLQGTIRAGNEAITYYKDPHELVGKCDFIMANPPFNVDEVDAEKVKSDKRLPFGLPGVNKTKKVSNANYLWFSYFYSYLNETGRAGVVMSSQASSAGRDEGKAAAKKAVYANRRRIRGNRGQRLLRQRGERVERPNAHLYETGGMRRVHLRGHPNILKRLLVHVCGFNLGLLMRQLTGVGTPRSLQGRAAALLGALIDLLGGLCERLKRSWAPEAPDAPDSSWGRPATGQYEHTILDLRRAPSATGS